MRRDGKQFERSAEMGRRLMMAVTTVAVAVGAWAATETVGGYTWTYRINGDTAEINNEFFEEPLFSLDFIGPGEYLG